MILEIARRMSSWSRQEQESYSRFKRSELEGEASDALQSEVFDEENFNKFFDGLLFLAGGVRKKGLSFAAIIGNKWVIVFERAHYSDIRKITTYPVSNIEKLDEFETEQSFIYKLDPLTNKVGPHLLSCNYDAPISNARARNFCVDIFNTYLASQNVPHPQTQDVIG